MSQKADRGTRSVVPAPCRSRVEGVIARGMRTHEDLRDFVGALMIDVVLGNVSYQEANAANAAAGRLLQITKVLRADCAPSERTKILTLPEPVREAA